MNSETQRDLAIMCKSCVLGLLVLGIGAMFVKTSSEGKRLNQIEASATKMTNPVYAQEQMSQLPGGIWESSARLEFVGGACSSNLISLEAVTSQDGVERRAGVLSTILHCIVDKHGDMELPNIAYLDQIQIYPKKVIDVSEPGVFLGDRALLIGFVTDLPLEQIVQPIGFNKLGCDVIKRNNYYVSGFPYLTDGSSFWYIKDTTCVSTGEKRFDRFNSGVWGGVSGGGYFDEDGCLVSITSRREQLNSTNDLAVPIRHDGSRVAEQLHKEMLSVAENFHK